MTSLQRRADPSIQQSPAQTIWPTLLFSLTILLSAALLFMVQPMFARMILPRLGGTPATWNTCLLFFQSALLVGYFYVHLTTTRLGHRSHVALHSGLLVVSMLTLPLTMPAGEPAGRNPGSWLLIAVATTVGLPFVALSTTAPLLQRWFTLLTGRDPYFLYAASNVGSFAGLLAYPFAVEPGLALADQRLFWSIGFVIVALLVAVCGIASLRRGPQAVSHSQAVSRQSDEHGLTPWADQLRWLALSFVPSSLLLGVTAHISTDIAAVPLLWVVPLAMYLATFVVSFASRPPISRIWVNRLVPFLILAAVARIVLTGQWWSAFAIHLVAFTGVALVCHRELAEKRPPAASLTRFYLWVSIGGALGGLFNALIAPQIFTQIVEYPLVLAVAALISPAAGWRGNRREPAILLWGLLLLAFGIAIVTSAAGLTPTVNLAPLVVAVSMCAGFGLAFANRRAPFAVAIAAIVVAHFMLPHQQSSRVIYAARSFFGVHRVTGDTDPEVHRLFHGTTLHGWQPLNARDRCEPTSYYHRSGPIGQVLTALDERADAVALIGLGAGALACYGRDDTRFTFYEIDPVVERIARDRSLFTFLANARGMVDVVIGDGRVTLAHAAPSTYDVIIVDAFSSDAIPVHLMTREFVSLALERLRPGGLIAFHISNRHLDLGPVLGAAANELGTSAVEQYYNPTSADATASRWLVIAKASGALPFPGSDARWQPVRAAGRSWTDDFSNILDVLQWTQEAAAGAR